MYVCTCPYRDSSPVEAASVSSTSAPTRMSGVTSVWQQVVVCMSLLTPSLGTSSRGARTEKKPESKDYLGLPMLCIFFPRNARRADPPLPPAHLLLFAGKNVPNHRCSKLLPRFLPRFFLLTLNNAICDSKRLPRLEISRVDSLFDPSYSSAPMLCC